MKKIFLIIAAVLVLLLVVGIILDADHYAGPAIPNDTAIKGSGRYLTIVNETGQVLNEVRVMTGEGTEIEAMRQLEPDAASFSIKIPKSYSGHSSFTVLLTDRYDLKYRKTVDNVSSTGMTEISISQADYIKEKGDFWDKVEKFFNGD